MSDKSEALSHAGKRPSRQSLKRRAKILARLENDTAAAVSLVSVVTAASIGVREAVSIGVGKALRLATGLHLDRDTPPKSACFLLDLFLSKPDRQSIPGDLVEEFEMSILPKYGPRRARFWFWAQAARAIAERNRLSRWMLVYGLGRVAEWIFKAIGS